MCKIVDSIIDWNEERGLKDFDLQAEVAMLREELEELENAKTEDEIIDALCDLRVIATGATHKLGYDPEEAMFETLREIHSRRGKFNPATGKWEKDKSEEAQKKWYKANYEKARYDREVR